MSSKRRVEPLIRIPDADNQTRHHRRMPRALRQGNVITVPVRTDPARRKRFASLVALLGSAKRKEASGFDAYWEAVSEIDDRGLFVDGGYETFDAFLAGVVKVKRRTAARMMRVAKYASPAEETTYGTALLDAALGYIEALTGGPVQGKLPIAFAKLRIPCVRDGKKTKRPLKEVIVAEVNRARLEILKPRKQDKRAPEEALLRAALAKDKALAGLDVRVIAGTLRFGPIPLGLVARLAKALAKAGLAM
jgi:hypothetical protein